MSEYYIQNLEDKIEGLARLVTNAEYEDRRFDLAVADFQLFLDNPEKNNLPRDLAKTLRNMNRSNYGNQQSYVDDLRREYRRYCDGKTKQDRKKEIYDVLLKPRNHASEEKDYSIDEDGVIHRNPNAKIDKNAIASAMDLLRNIQNEPEQKIEKSDDSRFWDLVADFKNRNGGKK